MWYYVYIPELNNGKHYVDCTLNLKERYSCHKKGHISATKPHLPIKLVLKGLLFGILTIIIGNSTLLRKKQANTSTTEK